VNTQLNQRKRLLWSKEQIRGKENFNNILFSDKYTVQLEEHSWIYFYKRHEKRRLNQRGKHSIKIWGGISKQGATYNLSCSVA